MKVYSSSGVFAAWRLYGGTPHFTILPHKFHSSIATGVRYRSSARLGGAGGVAGNDHGPA